MQKFCSSTALKETVICSPVLLCVTVTGDLPAVWACMLLPDLQRCPAVLPSVPWLYISAGSSLPRLKLGECPSMVRIIPHVSLLFLPPICCMKS